MSRQRKNELQRIRRRLTGNLSTRKYEKTKNGFLMRLYRNMKSRINGVQKSGWHLYAGLPLLAKEDFYAWAKASQRFHQLFTVWEASGYDRRLTPSVDRIDANKGYLIPNMEWVTLSENSRRGATRLHAA